MSRDRILEGYRTKPLSVSAGFIFLFALYTVWFIGGSAALSGNLPPNPQAEAAPPRGAEDWRMFWGVVFFLLIVLLGVLQRWLWYKDGTNWRITDLPVRGVRAVVVSAVFIAGSYLIPDVVHVSGGGDQIFYFYSLAYTPLFVLIVESFSTPLVQEDVIEADEKNGVSPLQLHLNNWSRIGQVLIAMSAIAIAIVVPFYTNTHVLQPFFILLLILPSIGVAGILCYILAKHHLILRKLM